MYEKHFKGLKREDLDAALVTVFESQRRRLAQYLNLPSGAEIILCPSGSDAEYIPIAMAKALHPTKFIANGITQFNEIGAGTEPASRGDYFSTHAPFLGANDLKTLSGFDGIKGLFINARNDDGSVRVSASEEMNEFCSRQLEEGFYPIIHGVFGGKTGVRDTVMPGSQEVGDKSMGVVDACQGRFTLDEIKQWMNQESVVLFTTSKFFQAPPFCGAVIVPPGIAKKLSSAPAPMNMIADSMGLGAFLTDKELPVCLQNWKNALKNEGNNNVGLALRWEAGLAAMEALSSVPDTDRMSVSHEWASAVKFMVDSDDLLDIFSIERSIVSIRIGKHSGGWLDMVEARDLYRWMSLEISGLIPHATDDERMALSTIIYIGQPVSVSDSHAIVRIALGVESLLTYTVDKVTTLKEDEMTVRKLAAIAKYFDHLKASGS
jgi:hypothetical protein